VILSVYRVLHHIYLSLFVFFLIAGAFYLTQHYYERHILKEAVGDSKISSISTHQDVVDLKFYLLNNYVRKPVSDGQEKVWLNKRTIFRQSAVDTLRGQPAYCGEFSRLMINALRVLDVKAKRLYVYKDYSTNHVLFEYYNKKLEKWVVLNSYLSSAYIETVTNNNTFSKQELFDSENDEQLIYTNFGYLNQNMLKFFGQYVAENVPEIIIWLFDEPMLIRFLLSISSSLFFLFLFIRSWHHFQLLKSE
jgi:hypothetical protein